MTSHILKCCGKYTMNEECSCGKKAVPIKPFRYSPEDHYGKYRRIAKEAERKKKKLIQ